MRGFTLIEIIIVLGILAAIAGLGLVVNMDFYKTYAFQSERNTIVSLLQRARSESMANINGSAHGVKFDVNGYTLFQDSGSSHDQFFSKNPSITLTTSPALPVTFAQLSGTTTQTSIITITDATGRPGTITVSPDGQIDW